MVEKSTFGVFSLGTVYLPHREWIRERHFPGPYANDRAIFLVPLGNNIIPLELDIKERNVIPRELASNGTRYVGKWSEEKWMYEGHVDENEQANGRDSRLKAIEYIFYDGHLW